MASTSLCESLLNLHTSLEAPRRTVRRLGLLSDEHEIATWACDDVKRRLIFPAWGVLTKDAFRTIARTLCDDYKHSANADHWILPRFNTATRSRRPWNECAARRRRGLLCGDANAYYRRILGCRDGLKGGTPKPLSTARRALARAPFSRASSQSVSIDCLATFFTAQLLKSGVEFVACDVPYANRLTIQILAVMADHESRMISARTCAANAVARTRGVDFRRPQNVISSRCWKLRTTAGHRAAIERSERMYRDLVPIVANVRAAGPSLKQPLTF